MHPDPQFFMMGAARPSGGELEVLDFDRHPQPSIQQIQKALTAALKQAEDSQSERADLDLGVKNYKNPKVRIGGKAKVWPSIIGPYSSSDPVIVHQDVAEALNSGDYFGFHLKQVQLRWGLPLQLMLSRRPRYFALETKKHMDYYLRVYERKENLYTFCCEIRDFADPEISKLRSETGRFEFCKMPILESWDGSAFFHLGERKADFGALGSSREFLDLAHEAGWTGFSFHPIDALGDSLHDFRSRPWPPSLWYPNGQPA